MNRYGARAQRHWKRWLPKRYSQLNEPDSFFSNLGEEVEERIEELWLSLAGPDPGGEEYMEKLGRLNMARLNAESAVLREAVLLPPEEDTIETSAAQE